MEWPKVATVKGLGITVRSWLELDEVIDRYADTISYVPRPLMDVLLNPPDFPTVVDEYPIVQGMLW
jgi:hypothetical protein